MRDRVSAYNVAVGGQNTPTSGYHETVTVFWIKLLASHLAANPDSAESRATFATLAVARFANDRDILSRHYDYDVVASVEARRTWLPPTLLPLE